MDRVIFLVILAAGLSACSTLERSNESGYASNFGESSMKSVDDFYANRARERARSARTELGLDQALTLSEGEASAVRARIDLHRLEQQLEYDAEKKQYYSFKPFFKNDYERIQFLQLPTREARQRWAQNLGLKTSETEFDTSTQQLIESNNIARGMSKDAVAQSWGTPDVEEFAGNPIYGNMRWVYNKQVSTDQGYKNERRMIYFESGRVVGWETQ